MSDFVRHLRLSQLLLVAFATTMAVAVWGSDDRVAEALSELRAIMALKDKWDGGEFLDEHVNDKISRNLYIHVNEDGGEYVGNETFAISPMWTLLRDPLSLDEPHLERTNHLVASPLPEACQRLAPESLRNVISEHGTSTVLLFPEELSEYIGVHDAMIHRIEIELVTRARLNSVYYSLLQHNANREVKVDQWYKLDPSALTQELVARNGAQVSERHLCFVRQSIQEVVPNSEASLWMAISTFAAESSSSPPVVGIVVAVALETTPHIVTSTGHDALGKIPVREFAHQYPALSGFLGRYESREDLSIDALVSVLEELNKVESGSLPLLNLSLPIHLVPWFGFPLLFAIQLYVFYARRTLLKRIRGLHNGWWHDVAWIQTFWRARSLRWVLEWISTGTMIVLIAGLWNYPFGARRVGVEALPFVAVLLISSFLVSIRDTQLGLDFDRLVEARSTLNHQISIRREDLRR